MAELVCLSHPTFALLNDSLQTAILFTPALFVVRKLESMAQFLNGLIICVDPALGQGVNLDDSLDLFQSFA